MDSFLVIKIYIISHITALNIPIYLKSILIPTKFSVVTIGCNTYSKNPNEVLFIVLKQWHLVITKNDNKACKIKAIQNSQK